MKLAAFVVALFLCAVVKNALITLHVINSSFIYHHFEPSANIYMVEKANDV